MRGRTRATRAAAVAALAVCATSCASESGKAPPPPADQQAALGGEVAARVGSAGNVDVVPLALVAAVAREQRLTPQDAARRLVDDAVAAVAARDRGLDGRSPASWLLVAARGRMTADRIRQEAKRAGPPTNEEVEQLSALHWREVDRPPSIRVVHAIVKRPKKNDPALVDQARALAGELRAALVDASSQEEFMARTKAFAHPKELEVLAQPLPAFTADGHSVEGPDQFHDSFVKAAWSIAKPGDSSPVSESKDGFHVIRLLEKLPEHRMPFETRRLAFGEEAWALRAQRALDARLAPLRAANPVSISPSAETLMRSVMTQGERPE